MPSEKRQLKPGKLIAATHNKGKVRELRDLFEPLGFEVVSAIDLDLDEPDETDNALGGAPGIFSARWAGQPRDFNVAMQKVERELADIGTEDRSAKFVCALAVVWPDGHAEVWEGYVHGTLVWPPRGDRGFGYDPMFVAEGETVTFGEMEPAKKHAMSHRADAVAQLKAAILE